MNALGPEVLKRLREVCLDVAARADKPDAAALERAAFVLSALVSDLCEKPALADMRDSAVAGSSSPREHVRADLAFWEDYEKRATDLHDEAVAAARLARDVPQAPAIDGLALQDFLRAGFPGEQDVTVVSQNLASLGQSKTTVLVGLSGNQTLPDSLALRIDRPFNYLGTSVVQEYPVVDYLWRHGVRLPRPIALEASGTVLGQPFIISELASGTTIGSIYVLPARPNEALLDDLAVCLAGLHGVPIQDFPGDHADVADALDAEIEKYWNDWQSLGQSSIIVEQAFAWIKGNRDRGLGEPSIVHNDFALHNILIDGDRVSAIVDWEFAQPGVAAADLAYFYYAAEALGGYRRFAETYAVNGGTLPPGETFDFYLLWGQLRLAVMHYQVIAGFNNGSLADLRFSMSGARTARLALVRVGSKLAELLDEG
jgi:aminoglycoside phosphotransferase (APT) family kinase protein